MQPIFITGATGFLGAHLVCELLQKGYDVKALKRPQSSLAEFDFISGLYFGQDPNNVLKNIRWVEGDVLDMDSLEDAIEEGMIVFHCAAIISFNSEDREHMFKVNVRGTENVVNVCLAKKVTKLVYASSIAAVGKSEQGTLTDETAMWDEKDEPSNYSRSKYHAELEVWRGVEEGLNAVIVNPPLIIGPGNWKKATGRFFWNGFKNFPFYTKGSNAFVYVKDVAKAMVLLSELPLHAERYILVSENLRLRDFMNLISDAFGKRRPFLKISSFTAGIAWRILGIAGFFTGTKALITRESAQSSLKNIAYSNKKIKDATGFEFTSIATAVNETVDAFKKVN